MKIPTTIRALGAPIRVRYATRAECAATPGKLGWWHRATMEVVLRPGQPKVGELVILVHELLHVVDDLLIDNKVTRRRTPHAWVEAGAFGLATLLIHTGAIQGVTVRQWRAFVRAQKASKK